jgi:serpin B
MRALVILSLLNLLGIDTILAQQSSPEQLVEVAPFVQSQNEFGLDLYHQLQADEGNLFLSPSSVALALAMTYAGADGETRAEMAKTCHWNGFDDQLHATAQALLQQMRANSKTGIQLTLANRLWGQSDFHFLASFLAITQQHYGAELARVDFAQAEQTRQTINAWVAENTQQKITSLLSPSSLSADSRLVLTNAVYFKGNWRVPFGESNTQEADFHLTSSKTISVPMMHRAGAFQYASNDQCQVLDIPYGDGSLSMILLLPKEVEGLAAIEALLNIDSLHSWLSELKRENEVRVYLPKFKSTSQFQLSQTLQNMGMRTAFDPQEANFSGMTGEPNLFISSVVHKAFVEVNEQGTEAAAATGITMSVTSAPAEPPREPPVFRADHPFLYLIRDNRNSAILFLGRLQNPQD